MRPRPIKGPPMLSVQTRRHAEFFRSLSLEKLRCLFFLHRRFSTRRNGNPSSDLALRLTS